MLNCFFPENSQATEHLTFNPSIKSFFTNLFLTITIDDPMLDLDPSEEQIQPIDNQKSETLQVEKNIDKILEKIFYDYIAPKHLSELINELQLDLKNHNQIFIYTLNKYISNVYDLHDIIQKLTNNNININYNLFYYDSKNEYNTFFKNKMSKIKNELYDLFYSAFVSPKTSIFNPDEIGYILDYIINIATNIYNNYSNDDFEKLFEENLKIYAENRFSKIYEKHNFLNLIHNIISITKLNFYAENRSKDL